MSDLPWKKAGVSARWHWVQISLLIGGLTPVAFAGCGKKARTEPQPAASATAAPTSPAPAAAPSAPSRPEPRLLAHISPAWGKHGQLPAGVGLKVGELIPDVAGLDSEGKQVRLREAAKEHAPLVLLFYRGGFCDFTAYHLRAIAVQAQAFRDSGAKLIMISPDTREQVASTKAFHKLEWPMLSDPEIVIGKAFHLEHQLDEKDAAVAAKNKIPLPLGPAGQRPTLTHPAVFVVDADGKIKFAHADTQYDRMLAYSQILNGIEQARGAPKPTPP